MKKSKMIFTILCFGNLFIACSNDTTCESDRDCAEAYFCLSGVCQTKVLPDDGAGAGTDAGIDAGSDPGIDAGSDAGSDSGSNADAGSDPGTDAGADAGSDPGTDDADTDAGDHTGDSDQETCIDPDHDGYGEGSSCLGPDCAPEDASRHPGAEETCNGLDDDCDDEIDEDDVCPQANPYLWVFILAGQSNMVGLGVNSELGAGDASGVANTHIFCDLSVHNEYNPNCLHWVHPVAPGFGVLPDRFGPELSFARRLHELWPARSIAIIKIAEGGTGLYDRWDARNGDLYQLLINQVNQQMSDLHIAWSPRIAGFVWMQGETDACDSGHANAYYFNLRDFMEDMREDLGVDLIPITAGLIAEQPMWPEADKVRDATSLLAENMGPMNVVETTDLPRHPDDPAHYNTVGQLELGRRFADGINEVLSDMDWDYPGDFTKAQGDGFWRYETCMGSTCSLLSWDYFHNRYKNATSTVLVGNGWVQPANLQTAELTWWAPYDGDIQITASADLLGNNADGTSVTVKRDGAVLSGPYEVNSSSSAQIDLNLNVQQGQVIKFITDCGSSPGGTDYITNWQISIHMTHVSGD